MSSDFDTISNFLQSGFGVTLQIIGIIGATIPAIKYFNSRFEQRVNKEIESKVNPTILKICEQLKEIVTKFEKYEISNDLVIKFINERIEFLQKSIYQRDDKDG